MFSRCLKGGTEGAREPLCPAPSAEETLLRCGDLALSLRLLRADCLSTGLELLRRIQERLLAILQHSTQVCGPTLGLLGPAQPLLWGDARGKAAVWRPGRAPQLLGQPAGCGWALPRNHLASATK